MRHKYDTRAIVLARSGVGEANTLVTLLTEDIGLVRARAQGLRRASSKLAHALQTLAESRVVLIRGKEQWRLSGAVLLENHFTALSGRSTRERAGRISQLLTRLVAGEAQDPGLFALFAGFLAALPSLSDTLQDAAEILTALRVLRTLGFDDGEPIGAPDDFSPEFLLRIAGERSAYIARVNRGIAASGL